MARTEKVYTVFVASPGDVSPERDRLEQVIRELNVTWSKELGLRLDLLRWETNAFPAFGTDAQDVINEQVGDEYDLFIGIMWCRFGTPTERAASGTLEEFRRAKQRFDAVADDLQLMIYFKDEPVPPSTLDVVQLQQVNDFRKLLGTEGALYWRFTTTDSFESYIRMHLSLVIQKWKKKNNSAMLRPMSGVLAAEEPSIIESASVPDDEPVGFLDLVLMMEDSSESLGLVTERIAEATIELGERFNGRTAEMNEIAKMPAGTRNAKVAKRLVDRAANDMDTYVLRMNAELPMFRCTLTKCVKVLTKIVSFAGSHPDPSEIAKSAPDALAAVQMIKMALQTSSSQMRGFREAVIRLPRMTATINRAKFSLGSVLTELVTEMENAVGLLAEAEKGLEIVLNIAREQMVGDTPSILRTESLP